MARRQNSGDFRDNVENWDGYNSKQDTIYIIYMDGDFLRFCYSTKEALGVILDKLSEQYPNVSFKFYESFGVVTGKKINSQNQIDKFVEQAVQTIKAIEIDKKYKIEEEKE